MTPYEEGVQARIAGLTLGDNPYHDYLPDFREWQVGWFDSFIEEDYWIRRAEEEVEAQNYKDMYYEHGD